MATTMVGVLVSETLHLQSAGKLSRPIWRRQSRFLQCCRDGNMQYLSSSGKVSTFLHYGTLFGQSLCKAVHFITAQSLCGKNFLLCRDGKVRILALLMRLILFL